MKLALTQQVDGRASFAFLLSATFVKSCQITSPYRGFPPHSPNSRPAQKNIKKSPDSFALWSVLFFGGQHNIDLYYVGLFCSFVTRTPCYSYPGNLK